MRKVWMGLALAAVALLLIPDPAHGFGRRRHRGGDACCCAPAVEAPCCCAPAQAMNACCGQVVNTAWAAPCPCNQQGGVVQTQYQSAPPPAAAMPEQPGQTIPQPRTAPAPAPQPPRF